MYSLSFIDSGVSVPVLVQVYCIFFQRIRKCLCFYLSLEKEKELKDESQLWLINCESQFGTIILTFEYYILHIAVVGSVVPQELHPNPTV